MNWKPHGYMMSEGRFNTWLFNFSKRLNDRAWAARLTRDGKKYRNNADEMQLSGKLNTTELLEDCICEIVKTKFVRFDPNRRVSVPCKKSYKFKIVKAVIVPLPYKELIKPNRYFKQSTLFP